MCVVVNAYVENVRCRSLSVSNQVEWVCRVSLARVRASQSTSHTRFVRVRPRGVFPSRPTFVRVRPRGHPSRPTRSSPRFVPARPRGSSESSEVRPRIVAEVCSGRPRVSSSSSPRFVQVRLCSSSLFVPEVLRGCAS